MLRFANWILAGCVCDAYFARAVVEVNGSAQWSNLQATSTIVMIMDTRPFGIRHLVGSRHRLECASCTE